MNTPLTSPSFAVGFARRQTPTSCYSHFESPDGPGIVDLVSAHFGRATPVNEAGTILRVPVPPEGFWSAVRPLVEGEAVVSRYLPRRPGEEAVLSTMTSGAKAPARHVEIILYHRDALGEDASTSADWEIVSINASPFECPFPMDPVTMARNQLQKEGGTFQRTYTSEEWAAAVWFWAQHANVEPSP